MPMSPLYIVSLWFRGLLTAAIIWAGVHMAREWYDRSHVRTDNGLREDRRLHPEVPHRFAPSIGLEGTTALLAGAFLALTYPLGGGLFVTRLVLGRSRRRADSPSADADDAGDRFTHRHPFGDRQHVRRSDMSSIDVYSDGTPGAPTLVLLHGLGYNSREWNAPRPDFRRGNVRTVAWDMPGLGHSDKRPDNDYSPDAMAADLRAVLDTATAHGPVILVGHSIGGMTLLSFCRKYPDLLGPRVAGVVLAHTTYTNPLKTMRMSGLLCALQKPLIEPLLWLTLYTWPLVWLLQWSSYLNGSTHRWTHRSGFSGRESREQLDFAAWFAVKANPAVLARATLGMLHWDASEVPQTIRVPLLVVAGDKDPTTKPEAGETIADRAPNAELFVLPEAKHMGPIEFATEFAERVMAFASTAVGAETADKATATRDVNAPLPGVTAWHADDDAIKTSPDTTPIPDRARQFDRGGDA